MTLLVTRGARLIGSNCALDLLKQSDGPVVNPNKFTHAGNLENLSSLNGGTRQIFVQSDLYTVYQRGPLAFTLL